MMEELKDSEQADLLRQRLKKIDAAKEESSEEDSSADLDIEKQIAQLTDNYRLTYKEVKDHLLLKTGPLADIERKRVMQLI